MPKSKDTLIEESKKWIGYFYKNGEWFSDVNIKFNGRFVDKEIVDFMQRLFKFFTESSVFSKSTILWLNSNLPSVKATIDFYNEQVDELDRININTAKSAVQYDKNKISKYFDKDLFFHLMTYPEKYLEGAMNILYKLEREYMEDREYTTSLVVRLPKDIIKEELDDYSFVKLTNALGTYSVRKIKNIERLNDKEFTPEMIGYYNYLISSKSLKDFEKIRLKEIKEILGIPE